MGRRGPAPAPTRLKLLRGETRPSRVNYREPLPLRNLPAKPADLTPGAAAVWDLAIAELGHTGVLTAVDGEILRAYAETADRRNQAAQTLAATGPLIRGARGNELVKNPLHAIVRDDTAQLLALARELGLTPSSRSGIRAPQGRQAGSRLEAFLARRSG